MPRYKGGSGMSETLKNKRCVIFCDELVFGCNFNTLDDMEWFMGFREDDPMPEEYTCINPSTEQNIPPNIAQIIKLRAAWLIKKEKEKANVLVY
jgi:hypothetical protein